MLLNLSHGKQDFFKEIVESFANKNGSFTLVDNLFESGASRERSFIGTDDIGNISPQAPIQVELNKYDSGKRSCFLKFNTTFCTRSSSTKTLYYNKRWIPRIAIQTCPNILGKT